MFSALITDTGGFGLLAHTPEKPAGAGLEIMTVLAVLTMCAFTFREIMMETVNGIL